MRKGLKWLLLAIVATGSALILSMVGKRDIAVIGSWQVRSQQVEDVNKHLIGGMLHTGPDPFVFDGKSVTLWFLDMRGAPPDQQLRLHAKMDGNELWYRHPAGDWVRLAEFDWDKKCFLVKHVFENDTIIWHFERKEIAESFFRMPVYHYSD